MNVAQDYPSQAGVHMSYAHDYRKDANAFFAGAALSLGTGLVVDYLTDKDGNSVATKVVNAGVNFAKNNPATTAGVVTGTGLVVAGLNYRHWQGVRQDVADMYPTQAKFHQPKADAYGRKATASFVLAGTAVATGVLTDWAMDKIRDKRAARRERETTLTSF